MLSAIITALVFVVMGLIIVSLIISAKREREHYKRVLATTAQSHISDRRVTVVLSLESGKPKQHSLFTLPSSWYTRRRTLVSFGLLIMIMLALCVQESLGGGMLQNLGKTLNLPVLSNSQPGNVKLQSRLTASELLIRIDSADTSQYDNIEQRNAWMYSSCSGIAMQMVMNSYGLKLRSTDVLKVELQLGVWSTQLGLLREEGIAMTAAHFGFDASLSHDRSLQEVINIANGGTPVIVSLRDAYYYPNGHIFVIRAGDNQNVYIADSAPTNFTKMSHATFTAMWQEFSAVLTPRNTQ